MLACLLLLHTPDEGCHVLLVVRRVDQFLQGVQLSRVNLDSRQYYTFSLPVSLSLPPPSFLPPSTSVLLPASLSFSSPSCLPFLPSSFLSLFPSLLLTISLSFPTTSYLPLLPTSFLPPSSSFPFLPSSPSLSFMPPFLVPTFSLPLSPFSFLSHSTSLLLPVYLFSLLPAYLSIPLQLVLPLLDHCPQLLVLVHPLQPINSFID